MTANPFAALLRHVEAFTFKGNVPQPDAHGKWVRRKDVIAALAAAVPADLAEAGKVLEGLRAVCTCNIDSTPCMSEDDCRDAVAAADTITALLARIAAQAAQIKGLEAERDHFELERHKHQRRAMAAETALAAERSKTAKLVEALERIRASDRRINYRNGDMRYPQYVDGPLGQIASAAITEADHE